MKVVFRAGYPPIQGQSTNGRRLPAFSNTDLPRVRVPEPGIPGPPGSSGIKDTPDRIRGEESSDA